MSEFRATAAVGVVTLSGDIDAIAALDLRAMLEAAMASSNGNVTVDMSAVTFIDSSGLNELVRPTHGGQIVAIRGASPFVRDLFEVTGLDVVLKIEE